MAKKSDPARFHKPELLCERGNQIYFYLCNCEACIEGRGHRETRIKDDIKNIFK